MVQDVTMDCHLVRNNTTRNIANFTKHQLTKVHKASAITKYNLGFFLGTQPCIVFFQYVEYCIYLENFKTTIPLFGLSSNILLQLIHVVCLCLGPHPCSLVIVSHTTLHKIYGIALVIVFLVTFLRLL